MNRAMQLKLLGYWCRLQGTFNSARVGEAALKQFVKPPQPNITPKQLEFLAQAKETKLTFQGKSVAVFEWGDANAPYVFSAYGWAYNAGRWRHFAPALNKKGYRFIAVDYLGHGKSEYGECDYPTLVALLKHVVEHFGPPALLLAHSFGAGISIEMISQLDVSYHPSRIALMAGFSHADYIFRQYASALGFGESQYKSLLRAIEQRTGKDFDSFDPARKCLELGHIEALIAHDPADEVTAFSNAVRLAEHFPNAYLFEANGAGHGFTEKSSSAQVLRWLLDGIAPKKAVQKDLRPGPMPTMEGFVSDFFR